MAVTYKKINAKLQGIIASDCPWVHGSPYRCDDGQIVRRDPDRDKASLWRPAFVRDIEKIMHLPFYNRYADKTQVFSFYRNDDITRRGLHVQLVSRIARNIGRVLGLNQDLIEAIALGHDIGHTPFGHAGERYLSQLLEAETGKFFHHNVQSVRVLEKIFPRNISLQTLDGILCHNGEFELGEYRPAAGSSFENFDIQTEACAREGKPAIEKLIPCTLEGCVVRVCDMIAYLGKDRQDAVTARILEGDLLFTSREIGINNAAIINNLVVDIIENSYGKPYIKLSRQAFMDLKAAKKENYSFIYRNEKLDAEYEEVIKPMFRDIYYRLLNDLIKGRQDSFVYRHHLNYINRLNQYTGGFENYASSDPNEIVADYIASMTDDYFIDLYGVLFPERPCKIKYRSYFD